MAKDFYAISAKDCLSTLGTSKSGLSAAESTARLEKFGTNTLPQSKRQSKIVMFLKQFADVMTIILLVAAAISGIISIVNHTPGELVDCLIILGIVFLNASIGFWQECKAMKSMDELKKLTQPIAKVLRGGKVQKIPSANLVVGDVVVLEAGDIVPADLRILEGAILRCDESALTGESVPVEKDFMCVLPHGTPLAERKNMAFSSSIVANGRGLGVVVATGAQTEIGKIATMLSSVKDTQTPLQKGISGIAKATTILVLGICVITFFIELFVANLNPLNAFLTAVALAVAAIPESLPAVITIIMSIGVARLAKQKAIVKSLHAIETLGCCQVICSDKTGTLTQNKMQVQSLFYANKMVDAGNFEYNPDTKKMLEIMLLCESVEPSATGWVGDPTELALVHFAENWHKKNDVDRAYPFLGEIPFDSNRKLMTSIRGTGFAAQAFTKGAVDELLALCTHIQIDGQVMPLLPSHKTKILSANKEMATHALRVLALGYKPLGQKPKLNAEKDLIFVGLVGMFDPPRKEVKRAVEKCQKAGVLPVMITGDHKNTALAIARKIGLCDDVNAVITGAEIDKLSDEKFKKIIHQKRVFARVSPENKVRIVETYKSLGFVVAMTGDGVNDAPSIKKADIGIGMGESGTDVAKEASDVIITDDNFATIIIAVQEGRKTFVNIRKTIQFLYSANLAEITAIFLATIFWPQFVFLTPVQILFVNLISDTMPAIALGLEPAEKNLMENPPRDAKKSLLSGGVGINILSIGIIQGIIMLSCFLFGILAKSDALIASTMAFYALNIIQFFYFISMRTGGSVWKNPITQNPMAVWAVIFCLAFVAIVAITPISTLLGLCTLSWDCWIFIGTCGGLMFFISELLKTIGWHK